MLNFLGRTGLEPGQPYGQSGPDVIGIFKFDFVNNYHPIVWICIAMGLNSPG
jgi:hypothetical protein